MCRIEHQISFCSLALSHTAEHRTSRAQSGCHIRVFERAIELHVHFSHEAIVGVAAGLDLTRYVEIYVWNYNSMNVETM